MRKYIMRMLIDNHAFVYPASVPWPRLEQQLDWIQGIDVIEQWLRYNIGGHWIHWAWNDSQQSAHIGVAFRWDRDRSLFVLAWG